MGDVQYKPGHYWDWRECAWVAYSSREPVAAIPAPAEPGDDMVAEVAEADAPAG
jgi:hypothetical protein